MSDTPKDPSTSEIIAALQGMWRQTRDLVSGVETRLGSKLDATAERLDRRLAESEERLGERLAREIQDRPVVVHINNTA